MFQSARGGSRGSSQPESGISNNVSSTQVLNFYRDETEGEGIELVEFRLVYEGPLPAAGGKAIHNAKRKIRERVHEQLKKLWSTHPHLAQLGKSIARRDGAVVIEILAEEHGGFVPLVSEEEALSCELDILFLRREPPGRIVSSGGGDIDNRLKVLLDALAVPKFGEVEPLPKKDWPFFVLLEDDSLITKLSVTTDVLFTEPAADTSRPSGATHYLNDVQLVLAVRVKVISLTQNKGNIGFLP